MMDIEKLAEEFFEWDGPRTPVVSFVRAKLFARHVAELALKEAARHYSQPHVEHFGDNIAEHLRTLAHQLTTPPQEHNNG